MKIPAAQYYSTQEMVRRFRDKPRSGFFRSETALLDTISVESLRSVLDVGCAAGRFLGLLRDYGFTGSYTGIDVVAENLSNAWQSHPDATFLEGDVLQMPLPEKFDLVNATGILQNEPRYTALLDRMLATSSRYVMFDVKVADIEQTLVDPDVAYCEWEGCRLPVVCLSSADFRTMLQSLAEAGRVRFLSYPTPFNSETVVPSWLARWSSVGVLVDLKDPALDGEAVIDLSAKGVAL
ncbi:class I SAM-dependent methyltransferase [Azospirillum argentinense]|uniref:Methyltransferase domain-containing protein n=1 Tax=Azospirillum argentinense TaxID=2970906 RepID=A0A5B0KPY2_9PROT|nr:class I SAM-dependent methyltransferase [Azospirillum argentinense]KAA1053955.1 Methyltransferase domain protein [Azospirillum argentinense]